MKILNQTPFPFGPVPGLARGRRFSATLVVKGSFAIVPDQPARPLAQPLQVEGDVFRDEEITNEILYENDFSPVKPHADLLLKGTCHAPGGIPVPSCRVRFRVGAWSKSLAAIGPRAWKRRLMMASMSAPVPFKSMPLTWQNAFGGRGYRLNPVGKGYRAHELPTVEHPDAMILSPRDQPEPACFGPISRFWKPRAAKTGSFNSTWLKELWPGLPNDFDLTYFNAAPRDQQVPHLKGDEELAFENLDPEHPLMVSRLPSLRIRVFLRDQLGSQTRFREVPMKLDTLFADTDRRIAILLWRGVAEVTTDDLTDVAAALIVSEPLDSAPATVEQYQTLLAQLENPPTAAPPPEETPPAPKPEDPAITAATAEAAKIEALSHQVMRSHGFDPAEVAAKGQQTTFGQLVAELQQMRVQSVALDIPVTGIDAMLASLTGPFANADKEVAVLSKIGPPKQPPTNIECAAMGRMLAEKDLADADFSGLDLVGADFRNAILKGANFAGARLCGATFTGATLAEANFSNAMLQKATLSRADLTKAIFTGADLTDAKIERSDLSEAQLVKAVLAGASVRNTILEAANLEGANLAGCALVESDLSKTVLKGALLCKADLSRASVEGAQGPGVDMTEANLTALKASNGTDFTGGKFLKATADGSMWEATKLDGADFTRAKLRRADFARASLKGTIFISSDLRHGGFRKAVLEKAVLRDANIFRGSLAYANLDGADLRDTNLYEAEFLGASATTANFAGANLKMTKLA